MNRAHAAHRSRRDELIALAATQRDEISRELGSWQKTLEVADRARGVIGLMKRLSPVFGLALGVGMLFVSRSKSVSRLIVGASSAWRTTRSVLDLVVGARG